MTGSGRRPLTRPVVIAIVTLGIIGAIWLKVRLEAGAALERAQTFETKGDFDLAIAVYRQAIRWYSPGSGPVETSVDRLLALANQLETEGNPGLALVGYRALRTAIYGIRSIVSPYSEMLPGIESRIADLMAVQEGSPKLSDDWAARKTRHEALLAKDIAPHLGWSLMAVIAFLGWVGALFGLAFRGFDDESGALLPAQAAPWAAGILVTLGCWLTGLAFA
ncbi:MAG: hypothetical protein ACI9OJ_000323 [Myxococcota bacterium]|jgi:hypothetical protein